MYKKMTGKQFIVYLIASVILLFAVSSSVSPIVALVFKTNAAMGLGFVMFALRYLFAFGAMQRVLAPKTKSVRRIRLWLYLLAGYGLSIFITYFDPINMWFSNLLGFEVQFYRNFFSLLLPPAFYFAALLLAYRPQYKINLTVTPQIIFVIVFMLGANFVLSQSYHQVLENNLPGLGFGLIATVIETLDYLLIDAWICNADIQERDCQACKSSEQQERINQ